MSFDSVLFIIVSENHKSSSTLLTGVGVCNTFGVFGDSFGVSVQSAGSLVLAVFHACAI